ncbi:hypothetical protein FQZ97_1159340 [compost metagenome]
MLPPLGHRPLRCAGGANAEQGIDGDVPRCGWGGAEAQAGGARLVQGVAGIGWQAAFIDRVPEKVGDAYLGTTSVGLGPEVEVGRRDQAITAVVAGTAGDPDAARVGLQRVGQARYG